MSDQIRNDETVEPGTFVQRDGTLYEIIEVVAATLRSNWFLGHLRDMRGESIGRLRKL